MRLLVFGDVHGNLVSLEKLFKVEKNNFDRFVCHGDIVNYGPWSNECMDFLLNRNDGVLLEGNHEEYYSNGEYPGTNIVAKTFFSFCYPSFNKEFFPLVRKFEKSIELADFTIMHAIEGKYIFTDTEVIEEFADNTVIGHSHQQFHRIIDGKNLYNTGSLGQNRSLLNVADYLMIDTEKKTADLKSFIFDIEAVIIEMDRLNYPQICLDYYRSKKLL